MSIEYGSIKSKTDTAIAEQILTSKKGRGRPRGAENKFRNKRAAEILEELKVDPLRELIRIARRRKTPLDLRIACWAHVIKYCHPALSTTHVTAKTETSINVARQMTLVLERRPELADAMEKLALEMALAGDQKTIDITAEAPRALLSPEEHER